MQQHENLTKAIETVRESGRFFCKFLSANDVGANGSHQDGVYLSMKAWDLFFEEEVPSGGILDRIVKMYTEDLYPFESRLVYYSSKKEFRITRFWSNTYYEREDFVGALIVFIPMTMEDYHVFIFNTESEIENFIETFSLSMLDNFTVYREEEKETGTLIDKINQLVSGYRDFPVTAEMAKISREAYINHYNKTGLEPDRDLINWVDTEYTVFRQIEKEVYKDKLIKPFGELQPLLDFASSALNRRKSRAGRSLEHHVNYIFRESKLPFDNPGLTEAKRKPDFLLPSSHAYANKSYPEEKLILLGAKTTCKDRWRQVLDEGKRVKKKYLITLQQGISKGQMDQMKQVNLEIVVPKPYHSQYPKAYRSRLWSVTDFIEFAKEKYNV